LKRLVFAAIAADLSGAAPLRAALETVFTQDATLNAVWQAGRGDERAWLAKSAHCSIMPSDIGAASAASRRAASTGTVPRVSRGRRSSPTRSSNCAENPL
jgi:hypothetical protein